MNQVKALTYTVTSESALTNLQYHLKEALNILRKETKSDHGLLLNQREKHKDLHKKLTKNNCEKKFENLPVPRKQKLNLTERVGATIDARRSAKNISVAPKKQIPHKTFEEIITIVNESDMNSTVPTNSTNQSTYISLSSEHCRKEPEQLNVSQRNEVDGFDLKVIKNFNVTLQKPVLKNGFHTITYLYLVSVVVSHSQHQLSKSRLIDPKFHPGWLRDEVVNSFLFQIEKQSHKILYCGSTKALLISNGKNFRKMWQGKSFTSKQYLFIPFNPTNSHWILLFVKIKSGTLHILNPLKELASSITISMARDIVNRILQKKFGATNECTAGKMKHYLQQDAVNCCVLTCYYANQIAQGEFIPCSFSNLKKR